MLDRTLAPPFQKNTVLTLLTPQHYKSAKGTDLFVLSGGTQEVVRVELIAKAGKWYETSPGTAHFSASQLDKGTKTKSSFQLASLFDAYGAHLDISAGNDFFSITIYSLSRNLSEVLEVVGELIHEAIFPEQELMLSKNIALQNLKVNEEKTSYLAGKYFRKAIFGDHPYGRELDAHAIEQVEREKLASYLKSFLVNFQVVVSGHVNDTTLKVLTQFLDQLPTGKINGKEASFLMPVAITEYRAKEGSVQSTIRYGKRIISRQHPDFFDLLFTTHLLGGYFGSRLMKNIREDKGLTYGIFSSVQSLLRESYFIIGADVNCENRELTMLEIKKELEKLAQVPVSNTELETARNHFIGSLQSEVTTAFAHGDKFKIILLNELPSDYYQLMINRVNVIQAEDLQHCAAKYFKTESFTEVTVG
ncbi:insulinase family protein [Chryseotalea sanaruensis]|uniref:Insulinase family protein n=1 Tax=Chryseotalea sanaruensis TaxID=2482724 RepID=A0A401U758_9BACT|nr:pitrilysin family protein [Chryseotalea sanaruensis]GCC50715.1 insulinase family protein [Chryseotalea sanaruensis]